MLETPSTILDNEICIVKFKYKDLKSRPIYLYLGRQTQYLLCQAHKTSAVSRQQDSVTLPLDMVHYYNKFIVSWADMQLMTYSSERYLRPQTHPHPRV